MALRLNDLLAEREAMLEAQLKGDGHKHSSHSAARKSAAGAGGETVGRRAGGSSIRKSSNYMVRDIRT
jgi:hypothetical protein